MPLRLSTRPRNLFGGRIVSFRGSCGDVRTQPSTPKLSAGSNRRNKAEKRTSLLARKLDAGYCGPLSVLAVEYFAEYGLSRSNKMLRLFGQATKRNLKSQINSNTFNSQHTISGFKDLMKEYVDFFDSARLCYPKTILSPTQQPPDIECIYIRS